MNIDRVDISDHLVEKFLNNRVRLAVILMLVACGLIITRLYYLQILKGSKYVELSINNRLRITTIPAPRGIIFSKKNEVLASNNPSFDLNLIPQDTPDVNAVLDKISVMFNINKQLMKKKSGRPTGQTPL